MASCKQEFRWRSFGLGGAKAELFATPQASWRGMPWTFILYRLAIATYQVLFFILVLTFWGTEPFYGPVDSKAKWLIYVSDWTYIIVTAYFVWAFCTSLYWQLKYGRQKYDEGHSHTGYDLEMNVNNPVGTSDPVSTSNIVAVDDDELTPTTPWYFKVQRYLHAYSCAGSAFVTILFWVLEFTPGVSVAHVFNINVHGAAAALVIIDLFIVATPMRILHMIYPMLTAFVYFCFTAIYWAAGGTNPVGGTHIYSGNLDWGAAPGRSAAVAAVTVLIAAPILHLFYYALYRLRLAFGACCSCCKYRH